jgi:hypothetical protein
MPVSVHNPDQYLVSLRQILGQGRKRIGFLVGAGAPAALCTPGTKDPLIPAVAGLTKLILDALKPEYGSALDALRADLGGDPNIEVLLSRTRSLASLIGATAVHGLDGSQFKTLSEEICTHIGLAVNKTLPDGISAYTELVTWINGTSRQHAVEVFTTNYDQLLEQALERQRAPYFDGFAGSHAPFFDPSSVASNDLPSRWTRVWKLHGSLGWKANLVGEIVRTGEPTASYLIYPESRKYDQTQRAPYSALFDRLRVFLSTPDSLLLATGFSFADAHISARIDEGLAGNPSCSLFAFQFKNLDEEKCACEIASRRSNMSVFSPDKAMINGVAAPWLPGDPPTRDWAAIRATFWGPDAGGNDKFKLGKFDELARFCASVNTAHHLPVAATP